MFTLGKTGTAKTVVTENLTAQAMGSGSLPVYATPALAALMEAAACTCIEAEMEPGSTSVGTLLELRHLSATPVGMEVTAVAELVAAEGRTLRFSVRAFDAAGCIGEATHERVVVTAERFLARAAQKCAAAQKDEN